MEMKLNLCTEPLEDMIAKVLRKELPIALGKFFGSNNKASDLMPELLEKTASYISNRSNLNGSSNDIVDSMPDYTAENSKHILSVITGELNTMNERCGFYPKEFPQIVELLKNHLEGRKVSLPRKPFFVAKGNDKKLGVVLGRIYRRCSPDALTYEYLCLCRSLFVCYVGKDIDKNSFQNCTLYKYLKNKK